MPDPTSQAVTLPDGREVSYVRRRIIPSTASYAVANVVSVSDSDRLDLIAHQNVGSPEAFWQIADANEAMHPDDLTETVFRDLVIPIPRFPEGDK